IAGVLAALEAIAALRDAGLAPRRAIEVVAWTNEEGARFAPGMTGSRVFTGALSIEEARSHADSSGVTFGEAVDAMLARDPDVPQRAVGRPYHAYLELHIEQG